LCTLIGAPAGSAPRRDQVRGFRGGKEPARESGEGFMKERGIIRRDVGEVGPGSRCNLSIGMVRGVPVWGDKQCVCVTQVVEVGGTGREVELSCFMFPVHCLFQKVLIHYFLCVSQFGGGF
jgi:hypothetical protein